jgi:hypothetical protein
MSIDLSKCDRYDYHLVFRPDGQTIVNATKLATATTLKAQIMNIPSRYATSQYKSKKFYFVFNSARLSKADATYNLTTGIANMYLYVEGLHNDSYSNFYNLGDGTLDATPQHVQPSPLIFNVKIDPIKNHLTQSTYGTGTLAGLEAPIKSKGVVGKVFLKYGSDPTTIVGTSLHTHCVPRISATPGLYDDGVHETTLHTTITAIATTLVVISNGAGALHAAVGDHIRIVDEIMLVTIVDNNELTVIRARAHTTATTHTDGDDVIKLVNEQSYIETTVRVKQNGNENVIEDVANENYQIAGATVDVINSNQFSRIKEIGNPFGNEIRVGLAYNGLSLSQVGSTTATSYEINTEKSGFYGAFSINFSILCVHEDSKTDKY